MSSATHSRHEPAAREAAGGSAPADGLVLHIIEPTLRDQTGHCYSFVNDLVESDAAATGGTTAFHIWMRRDAENLFAEGEGLIAHRHFTRLRRRMQAARLYRRLLREAISADAGSAGRSSKPTAGHPQPRQRIFISTAETVDFMLLDWAARALPGSRIAEGGRVVEGGRIVTGGVVWPYVHWYNPNRRKMKFLQRMAEKHPGLEIVCSTESVKKVFSEAGFPRVHFAPYPRGRREALRGEMTGNTAVVRPFEKILSAGAARTDKGFPAVVELVALLKERGSTLPVVMQCSMTHKGDHTVDVARAIEKLKSLGYAHLTMLEHTLEHEEYQRMFRGAITLQPYDRAMFEDRISGVTLDSLTAGSPIIAPAGTWMARQAARFSAGVVLDDARDPRNLLAAVETILGEWDRFARNASQGGAEIVREHDSGKLLRMILEGA